jgi:hypothetical protein
VRLTVAKPCPPPEIHSPLIRLGTDAPPWYAAYTLPRHEKAVAQQLGLRQVETYPFT